jgi:molybdenum cofactor cytidylyltransferase
MQMIGVLLAAGRSHRMGRVKQLLPWPPTTGAGSMVAAAFDAVAPACSAMVVVVGHEADSVLAALGDRKSISVYVDSKAEMMSSVKAGLTTARALDATANIMLHLADHPKVDRETIERLVEESTAWPKSAVIPEFAGQGGHPVIVPAALVERILNYTADGGLRQFWLDHPHHCRRFEVDDRSVILDLDVPDDYRAGVELPYGD